MNDEERNQKRRNKTKLLVSFASDATCSHATIEAVRCPASGKLIWSFYHQANERVSWLTTKQALREPLMRGKKYNDDR